MPVYIATIQACEHIPFPDMVFRADSMVSAVFHCQEKLEEMRQKAKAQGLENHSEATIVSISEVEFELMDEAGMDQVVDVWKVIEEVEP